MSVDDFPQPGNLAGLPAAVHVELLPPVDGAIDLWWTALDRTAGDVADLAHWLSEAEHARARRFGTDLLRQRWIVGRATLRGLLGRALGVAPSEVVLRRGLRGRPELDLGRPLDFNVSHTRGMALIGIATALPAQMRIGVDVEHGERTVNADGLSRKFLTAREREGLVPMTEDERRRGFLRLWTCKEAMSKATGDALAAPFRRIDIATTHGPVLVDGPPPYEPDDWTLHPVAMPAGFLATVAIWHRIRSHQSGIS